MTTTKLSVRLLTLLVAFTITTTTTTLQMAFASASASAPAPAPAPTPTPVSTTTNVTGGVSCPAACSCAVAAQKNVAICQERGLSSIPRDLAKRTHFLDVSGNRIEALRDKEFCSLGLLDLETLVADSSGVATVHKGAFAGLRWLKELDLSNNSIVGLDPLVFADNKLLEMVNLSGNPIHTLVSFQFTALPMLRQLDLRSCALRLVQPEAFSNLLFLQSLNLRNNSLATLPKDLFTWLRYLDELDLRENPWRCDCDVQSLLILLSIRRLYTRDLSCTYREGNGNGDGDGDAGNRTTLWQHMRQVDLDCAPGIENSVKENLRGLSERLRQIPGSGSASSVAVAAATAAATTRHRFHDVAGEKPLFSSQRVESSLLPIALAAVAATVCFLCLVSCYAKCRRRRRHNHNHRRRANTSACSSSSSSSSSSSKARDCCCFLQRLKPWRSKNHAAAGGDEDDDDDDDFERTCYSNFDEDCSDISLTVEL